MKPYNTFKSIVFTLTTAFLFFCWGLISSIILSNPAYGVLLGIVISLGSYRLILKTIETAMLKIKPLKKLVFGNTYLEGKWVGCYLGLDKEPKLYIEYFEQSFDGLVIRGFCYNSDNTYKGTWLSNKAIINEENGTLSYTYETDMIGSTHKNQGLAIFNFERESKNKAPLKLRGFSSDIFTSQKLVSLEIKVEKNKMVLSDMELLQEALKLYENNKFIFYSTR